MKTLIVAIMAIVTFASAGVPATPTVSASADITLDPLDSEVLTPNQRAIGKILRSILQNNGWDEVVADKKCDGILFASRKVELKGKKLGTLAITFNTYTNSLLIDTPSGLRFFDQSGQGELTYGGFTSTLFIIGEGGEVKLPPRMVKIFQTSHSYPLWQRMYAKSLEEIIRPPSK